MIPILSTTGTLTGQGLGRLAEALSCIVTHEVNGEYELRMTYPVTGERYADIAENLVIWAEPDNLTPAQAFRIYRITRPLNGIVTIYARHIAYDMSGIVVKPFTASTLTNALAAISPNSSPSCPFTITSTRTVATQMKVSVPTVLWGLLGGQSGSFLDIYGGEWDFNNYTAELKTTLGTDRGVTVRYGKNLTKLEQDVTIEATYAGVFPFWYDEESGVLVKLTSDYISIPGATGSRLLLLDLSNEWETAPTEVQLQNRANAYITANDPGTPKISWKVNMAMLSQSEEFANLAILEQVMLGDTIHVYYEPMNLTASARAVKLEYDVLLERYTTVTLGRVKQNMAQIVAAEKKETAQNFKNLKSTLEKAIDSATDFITNPSGEMRFIYDANDVLQEIVVLDNPDISQAQSVWRLNSGGYGHSSTGYAGPYTLAITQNGAIVADFITAGTMAGNRVRTGLLEDEAGKNSWNLDTGALTITNGTINITTDPGTNDYIRLNWFNNDQTSMRILELYPGDSSLYGYGRIRMGVRGYNALSPDTYTLTFAEISHNWQGMTYAQEQYVNGTVSSRKTIAQCTANAVSGYWGSITNTGLEFLDPLDPNTVTATYPASGLYLQDFASKNMCDQSTFVRGSFSGQGVETASTSRLRCPGIPVSPGTEYKFSIDSSLWIYELHEYTSAGVFIKYTAFNATTATLTTTSTTGLVRILVRKSDNSVIYPYEITQMMMYPSSLGTLSYIPWARTQVEQDTKIDNLCLSDVGSKNLAYNCYSANTRPGETVNGVLFTEESDERMTVSGQCSSSFVAQLKVAHLVPGQYILTGTPSGGGTTTAYLNISGVANDTGLGSGVFTITTEGDYAVRLLFGSASFGSLTFSPMIRKASISDATYVPYRYAYGQGILTASGNTTCSASWKDSQVSLRLSAGYYLVSAVHSYSTAMPLGVAVGSEGSSTQYINMVAVTDASQLTISGKTSLASRASGFAYFPNPVILRAYVKMNANTTSTNSVALFAMKLH